MLIICLYEELHKPQRVDLLYVRKRKSRLSFIVVVNDCVKTKQRGICYIKRLENRLKPYCIFRWHKICVQLAKPNLPHELFY